MSQYETKPFTDTIGRPDGLVDGCVLRVIDGPDAQREVELTRDAITVGAASGQALRLSDPTVSAEHARISISAAGIEVEDLGSRNGTFYLESRVQKATLPVGATVRFGRTRVMLVSRYSGRNRDTDALLGYGALQGASQAMQGLYALLTSLERHDYPVLVLGETGSGKELVAREIHEHSARRSKPYQICDCTTLPQSLAESELFGHVRGAFTGARDLSDGLFQRANGGTIFLDEIGDLPLDLQPKLLRVLETGEIRRLGETEMRRVDVRVVAATHRDLWAQVQSGKFREDLFYRLNAVAIEIPPLRTRREDIPTLVTSFIRADGHDPSVMSRETLELFTTGYDWPGNVRELRNAVRRVLALGEPPRKITAETVPGEQRVAVDTSLQFQDAKRRIIDAFERDYLSQQLENAHRNISQAARTSGVERMTFKRLLRKHGLIGKDD